MLAGTCDTADVHVESEVRQTRAHRVHCVVQTCYVQQNTQQQATWHLTRKCPAKAKVRR